MTKFTEEQQKDLIGKIQAFLTVLQDPSLASKPEILKKRYDFNIPRIRQSIPVDLLPYFVPLFRRISAVSADLEFCKAALQKLIDYASEVVTKSPDEQAEAFDKMINDFTTRMAEYGFQAAFGSAFGKEVLFSEGIELTPELQEALGQVELRAMHGDAAPEEMVQSLKDVKNRCINPLPIDPYSIEIRPQGSPEHQEAYRRICVALEAAARDGADLDTLDDDRPEENQAFHTLAVQYQTEMLSTLNHKPERDFTKENTDSGDVDVGGGRYVSDFGRTKTVVYQDGASSNSPLNLLQTRMDGISNLDTFFKLTKSYEPGKVVPINFFKVKGLQLAQSAGVDQESQNAYFATVFDSGVGSIINMIKGRKLEAANSLERNQILEIADKEGEGKLIVQCTAVEDGTAELGAYGEPVIKKYQLTRTETDGSTTAREVVYIEAKTQDTSQPTDEQKAQKSNLLMRALDYLKAQGALEGKGCICNCSEGMNRSASANVALAYDHLLTKTIRGLQERFPSDNPVLQLEQLRERLKTPVNPARPSYTEGDLLADKLRLYMNGEIIKSYKGREQNRFIARELVEKVINKEITLSISRMSADQIVALISHYLEEGKELSQKIANELSQRIKSLDANDLEWRLNHLCEVYGLEQPTTSAPVAEEGIAAGAGGPSAADAPSRRTALQMLGDIRDNLTDSTNKSRSLRELSNLFLSAYQDATMLLAQLSDAVAVAQTLLKSAKDTPVENILNIFREKFNEVLPRDQQIAADPIMDKKSALTVLKGVDQELTRGALDIARTMENLASSALCADTTEDEGEKLVIEQALTAIESAKELVGDNSYDPATIINILAEFIESVNKKLPAEQQISLNEIRPEMRELKAPSREEPALSPEAPALATPAAAPAPVAAPAPTTSSDSFTFGLNARPGLAKQKVKVEVEENMLESDLLKRVMTQLGVDTGTHIGHIVGGDYQSSPDGRVKLENLHYASWLSLSAYPKPLEVTPEVEEIFRKKFEEALTGAGHISDDADIIEGGALSFVQAAVDKIIKEVNTPVTKFHDKKLRENINKMESRLKDPAQYKDAIQSLVNAKFEELCNNRKAVNAEGVLMDDALMPLLAPTAPVIAAAAAPAPVAASAPTTRSRFSIPYLLITNTEVGSTMRMLARI